MNEKEKNSFEYTLKFISEVKESEYIKNNLPNIPISPRMNEPTVYVEDEEESTLLSFCN